MLSLAACTSDEEPTATATASATDTPADTGPKYGGTLKVGMLSDHVSFDPPVLLGLPDIVTVQATYDVLVFRNPDLTLEPMLAESWLANEDASVWTFNLRRGVKFSHGKELMAEDVIFTFNRMFEVESPLTSVMAKPTNMVAEDDYTVRFEFDGPNAPLLDSLVKYHAHITPSDVDPDRFATETFGTGPFRMTEHISGERTTFVRNDEYWWDPYPYPDDLIYLFLPSPEVRAEALKAGTVDMIYDLDASSIPTLQAHGETSVQQAPSGGYMNLAMDTRAVPFDNKLVRKAIQAATDRDAILQGAQFGLGSVAYDHPITPGDPVFNTNCAPPDYDPALAKSLLDQAGYSDGIDLTLYTSTAGASMVEMATVLKESFRPAGINLTIEVMPEDGYWAEGWLVKPFTTVWWGGRPPYEAFSVVYASGAAWNESYWDNAEADRLLNEALGAAKLADQQRIYGELQCLVIEEAPRIVTVFRPVTLGIRNDVKGTAPMWDATMSLHRVWLDQ
jgi:peptide/nickel transport system substrate-binding protein